MRLSLRFTLPLLISLGLVAYGVIPLIDNLTLKWFSKDIEIRTERITHSINNQLAAYMDSHAESAASILLGQTVQQEQIFAVGLCNIKNEFVYKTLTFPNQLYCRSDFDIYYADKKIITSPQGVLYISHRPILMGEKQLGTLLLVHDMSFVQLRSDDTKRYVFFFFVILGLIVSLITVLIAHLSWQGWTRSIQGLIREGA